MPKNYTSDAISAAVQEVKDKQLSIRKASQKYNVPKSTICDRVSGKVADGSSWGRTPKFSAADEEEMIDCAVKRSQLGIGFSKPNFLRFVGALGDVKGNPFKHGKPSDMWWRRFKHRNQSFSLRSPEPTGSIRHEAMNKDRLIKYFTALQNVIQSPNFEQHPSKIWNMDETGMTLSHRPNKVLARKGTKTIHGRASTSREMVTVIACGNANGGYLPPHFVIPGKTSRKLEGYDLEVASRESSSIKGANFSVSDSGWTKDGIARLWFTETFLKGIGPCRPQLLICDGHGSHNNVEFLDIAKKNDIIIVELPSHTSNWTQPFDRSVFKALKSHWNSSIDDFIKETGVAVGHKQFLRLFDKAWRAAVTPSTIRNGFAATGIWPFNPQIIPEEAYLPNQMYSNDAAVPDVDTIHTIDYFIDSQNDASSVMLSVPLGEEQIDLPVFYDSLAGLILAPSNQTAPLPYANEACKPSAKETLDALENSLTSEQKLKFLAALLSNNEKSMKGDKIYHTWKKYYNIVYCSNPSGTTEIAQSSSSSDLVAEHMFPVPIQSKRKLKDDYFVITADDFLIQKRV